MRRLAGRMSHAIFFNRTEPNSKVLRHLDGQWHIHGQPSVRSSLLTKCASGAASAAQESGNKPGWTSPLAAISSDGLHEHGSAIRPPAGTNRVRMPVMRETCVFGARERKQPLLRDRSGELRSRRFPYAARSDQSHRRSWRPYSRLWHGGAGLVRSWLPANRAGNCIATSRRQSWNQRLLVKRTQLFQP